MRLYDKKVAEWDGAMIVPPRAALRNGMRLKNGSVLRRKKKEISSSYMEIHTDGKQIVKAVFSRQARAIGRGNGEEQNLVCFGV